MKKRENAAPNSALTLDEATLAELRQRLQSGAETSQSLVEQYLARIAAVDRRGPNLCAIIETNAEAVAVAKTSDDERRAGRSRGPLHGIPILIKDNIDTADTMHTSAGCMALAQSIAPRDAFIVEKLRAAGAVLLGKTNMTEWANFRTVKSSSGYSGRGGQCRNPYALDRSPSGSSSGTGAAIAANLAAVGVGTETDGSITSPSAACGLVGIKPTVGLLSRSGIIPISHTQDTPGPMARTVTDAALLLHVMAGEDLRDAATHNPDRVQADYSRGLDKKALRGARLGVARKRYMAQNRHVDKLFAEALMALRALGATVIDPVDVVTEDHLEGAELTVLLYEFKAGMDAYLRGLDKRISIKSLADVIAWNDREARREQQYFGQELLLRAQEMGPLTSIEYRTALARCRRWSRRYGLDAVMTRHQLDAIVCPTQAPPWLIDLVNGDAYRANSPTPPAVAGYPHLTVPMGQTFGLPAGLSFFGRAWSEATLIKYAYAFEQETRARKPPQFLPTLGTG